MRAKLLSLFSTVLFLIGSIYYSYLHIKTAYLSMLEIKIIEHSDGSTGYKSVFSFSNINTASVLSILLFIFIFISSVLLIVFALKNKYHILTAVFSVVIIVIQYIFEKYTTLQELMFAKYVLNLNSRAYDSAMIIKYIPFIAALLLSIISFTIVILFRKSKKTKN